MSENNSSNYLNKGDISVIRNSQTNIIEANSETQFAELKSILKKDGIDDKDEKNIEIVVFKICSAIFIFLFMMPIIISDLYFGFTYNSCINKSTGIMFTMKMYLVGSAFIGVVNLLILICNICLVSNDTNIIYDSNLLFLRFIEIFGNILYLTWNIIGALVFWGTIYKKIVCDNTLSMYIYVSLILKLIGNSFRVFQILKRKN